jgi:L-ascorbate oxidase
MHRQLATHRTLQLATLIATALTLSTAQAQDAAPAPRFAAPALLKSRSLQEVVAAESQRAGTNLFSAAAQSDAIKAGREIHYVLPIKYTDGTINNPATGRNDPVRLRSYSDRFVAPTIVMKPGQTVRIGLQNQLPPEPDCAKDKGVNQPHCFNITNLHSHGLWVSPTGNSDNVLLSLHPGVDFEYEYNVPEDHPAGTFWYHPHKHGSTAMQVGSGMAGVLVVKGERLPRPDSNGDLDTLLRPFEPVNDDYPEVMLFQQVPYACFDDAGNIEKDSAGRWICKDGQVGEVRDFGKQMAFGTWGPSGRYTLINGVARPSVDLRTGRIYRWRMVHAGIREAIALRIRRIENSKRIDADAASIKEREREVERACTGLDVTQFEVAADGLTRDAAFAKVTNNLQPGYRSDVLFVLPEPGDYCVYDDSVAATQSVSAQPENAKVLGILRARGGQRVADQTRFITDQLIAAADAMPPDVRASIKTDLATLKLTRFVPHPAITAEEVAQSGLKDVPIEFNITGTAPNVKFMVNNEPYEPSRIDQTLILGKAQAWSLSSAVASHPFHIHVNPFQIVSVRKKDPTTKQPIGPELTDGQYTGMLGTWKDTIFVQSDVVIGTRTRYQRYIGEFVLHCHILDHEDQGMMQNVRIVLPDTEGRPVGEGHH